MTRPPTTTVLCRIMCIAGFGLLLAAFLVNHSASFFILTANCCLLLFTLLMVTRDLNDSQQDDIRETKPIASYLSYYNEYMEVRSRLRALELDPDAEGDEIEQLQLKANELWAQLTPEERYHAEDEESNLWKH